MKLTAQGYAVIEDDTHIGKWVEESGRLDHDLTVEGHILPLFRSHFHIVDAGANIGTHTLRYAQVATAGRVYAFEPNWEAYQCLVHNLRECGNTQCFQSGLSDQYEHAQFLRDPNAGGSHCVRKKGDVPCYALDSLHLPRLDFFKLDIEGYELFALIGAQETILAHRPTILVEMNMGTLARNGVAYKDVFEFLSRMGYEWRSFAQECDLMNEPQYDLLATPKTKTA